LGKKERETHLRRGGDGGTVKEPTQRVEKARSTDEAKRPCVLKDINVNRKREVEGGVVGLGGSRKKNPDSFGENYRDSRWKWMMTAGDPSQKNYREGGAKKKNKFRREGNQTRRRVSPLRNIERKKGHSLGGVGRLIYWKDSLSTLEERGRDHGKKKRKWELPEITFPEERGGEHTQEVGV